MKKLAIITTHPIQYYAPVFKLLAQRGNICLKVFYTWGEAAQQKFDPGFGKTVEWDIPLLEGYDFAWAMNTSRQPGSHHFMGIVTPYLNQQIRTFQPDALLVIGWAYHGHLAAMRHFKGKLPIFFRGDSTLLDEQPGLKNVLKRILLKWVYKRIDLAFYPGTNSRAYFKRYGVKENQLSFAPHAVDNERFSVPREEEAQAFRENLGIKTGDKLVLFAGKLEDKKNPLLLLKAFKVIKQPDTHLVFVGNGKSEADLKREAANHTNIHFINFINQANMPVAYQACNLFCLPSKGPGETWGLAVNEATACGKAVLISDKVGCAPDLVTPGNNGEVFESGNQADLEKKLTEMLSPNVDLKQYGLNSASMIKNWNFTRIAEAIESRLLNEKV